MYSSNDNIGSGLVRMDRRKSRKRLHVEQLEDRRVLAAGLVPVEPKGKPTDSQYSTRAQFDHQTVNATRIQIDQPVSLALENSLDSRWFVFQGLAGKRYHINAGVAKALGANRLSELTVNHFHQGHHSVIETTENGDVFLAVDSVSSKGMFQVAALDDLHGNTQNTATAIDLDVEIHAAIEAPAEEDVFTFHAVAGTKYGIVTDDSDLRVTVDGISRVGFGFAYYRAPQSGPVFVRTAVSSEWTTDRPREYRIIVVSNLDTSPGNDAASATAFGDHTMVASWREQRSDTHWFTFSGTPGRKYCFIGFGNISSTATQFDANGTSVSMLHEGRREECNYFRMPDDSSELLIRTTGTTGRSPYALVLTAANDDHGDFPDDATVVEPGTITAGETEFENETDVFRLDAIHGTHYVVALDTEPRGRRNLYRYVDDSWMRIPSGAVVVPDANGPIHFRVEGDAGPYELRISTVEDADAEGDGPGDATRIDVDSDVEAAIDVTGDSDWFVFSANATQPYLLEVEFSLNGSLRAFDADGTTLLDSVGSAGGNRGQLLIETSRDQDVYVSVDAPAVARYRLAIQPFNDDYPNLIGYAAPTEIGQTIRGQLDAEPDIDIFAVEVAAGVDYRFAADVDFQLRNRVGETVAVGDDSYDYTPIENEVVYVELSGSGAISLSGEPRNYVLRLSTYETDSSGNSQSDAITIEPDVPVTNLTESKSDQDWYVLSGVAGDRYEITRSGYGTFSAFFADGVSEPTTLRISNTGLVFEFETDGELYLLTTAFDISDFLLPSSYTLEVNRYEDDHGNTVGSATALDVGTTVEGRLDVGGEQDVFTFSAIAGTTYYLSIDDQTELRLHDGERLDLRLSSDRRVTLWTPESDKTVFLTVLNTHGLPESYVFQLLEFVDVDDHGQDAATATVVTDDSTTAGRVTRTGDWDWFKVRLEPNQSYELEVVEDWRSQPAGAMRMTVYAADGEAGFRWNGDEVHRVVDSPTGEDIFVRIEDHSFTESSGYEFSVRPVDDDHGNTRLTATTANRLVTGRIDFPHDLDVFAIHVPSAAPFRFATDSNVQLLLRDADGNVIDSGENLFVLARIPTTYFLEVEGGDSFTTTVDYEVSIGIDDHGYDPVTATRIEIGESVTGSIFARQDRDWFVLGGSTGESVAFDNPVGAVRVYDENGFTPLAEYWRGQKVMLDFEVDMDLFLEFEDNSAISIDYVFTPEKIEDDHGNLRSTATRIDPGSTVDGTAAVEGDIDWLYFDAIANVGYLVHADGASVLQSPYIISPTDRRIFLRVLTSEDSGEWQVTLTEYEDDHGSSREDATRITLDTEIDGRLEQWETTDGFLFFATPGSYDVSVGFFDRDIMGFYAYDEDGESLNIESGNVGRSMNFEVLEETEVYLDVGGDSNTTTRLGLNYSLVVTRYEDDFSSWPASATTISLNTPLAGMLENWGDSDVFAFEATAGTTYLLETPRIAGHSLPELRVIDRQRNELEKIRLSGALAFTPEVTGTYFAEVYHRSSSPEYELTISEFADDHGGSFATATRVEGTSETPGNLSVARESDFFVFAGEAGQTYSIESSTNLRLYDSDRNRIPLEREREVAIEAQTDGDIFVEVLGQDRPTTYSLEIIAQSDDHKGNPDWATEISADETIEGIIGFHGDVDSIRFDVTAGRKYLVTISHPIMTLRDESGMELPALFTATENGTVTVQLNAPWRTVTYELTVTTLEDEVADVGNTPESATRLEPEALLAAGSIQYPGDVDVFVFAATRGTRYELRSPIGSSLDHTFSFDGTPLPSLSTRNVIMEPAQDGDFHIEISSQRTLGDYEVFVDILPDDYGSTAPTAHPIAIPSEIRGRIDDADDVDWFAIHVESGDHYNLWQSAGQLSIYDSDGASILNRSSKHQVEWVAATTGEYFIEKRGGRDYTLVVTEPADFVIDAAFDAHDIDVLCRSVRFGAGLEKFDLNGDLEINDGDLTHLVEEIIGTRRGDLNLDGSIDFSDFLEFSRSFGRQSDGPAWTGGDFDCSGNTDFDDFLLISSNFGFDSSQNRS